MKQHEIFDDQFIVVTGASGFIGSNVVRYLNDHGRKNLLLVDDLKHSTKWRNLVQKNFVEFIPKNEIFDFINGREHEIEGFIHLGACSDTTETNAEYLFENNYRFSIRLAEYALKHDHRFIYASSAATYGNGENGFKDDEAALESLKPLNMYAFSKHLFDLWLKKENVLDKVIGLKYFNIFGPNEYHKKNMRSVILKMTHQIMKDGKVSLFKSNDPEFADGEQKRDFLYVKDAAKMTSVLLEEAFKDVGGIYNIGSGVATSWNDLVKMIFEALGKPVRIEYVPIPHEIAKQYQNYTCADMRKFNKIHGKASKASKTTSLKEAVTDYIQNYILKDEKCE